MIIKPIEDHETARYERYRKEITDLSVEFETWAKAVQTKYFGSLTEEEKEKLMFRFSDDLRYVVAIDVAALLGKK